MVVVVVTGAAVGGGACVTVGMGAEVEVVAGVVTFTVGDGVESVQAAATKAKAKARVPVRSFIAGRVGLAGR